MRFFRSIELSVVHSLPLQYLRDSYDAWLSPVNRSHTLSFHRALDLHLGLYCSSHSLKQAANKALRHDDKLETYYLLQTFAIASWIPRRFAAGLVGWKEEGKEEIITHCEDNHPLDIALKSTS